MPSPRDTDRVAIRVCTITPHLPPEQAANALLPVELARALATSGVETSFVAHPAAPGAATRGVDPFAVTWVPRRGRSRLARTAAGAAFAASRIALGARRAIGRADLAHLHSNGLIIEVAGRLAARRRLPYVITLYGTDVWHHDARRHARFARVVRDARHRVFYSRALLEFARRHDLAPEPASVIHAPVSGRFVGASEAERRALRHQVGARDGPLVVTVKRLHEVAGHEDLLRAWREVSRASPAAELRLAGDGPLRASLEAMATDLGVGSSVRFLGAVPNDALRPLLAAADLFVLPSRLESWGTVMLEALACGTPVVATDTAGALEARSFFADDVVVCAREDPRALASAILAALGEPRRATASTARILQERFSVSACGDRYRTVYGQALRAG